MSTTLQQLVQNWITKAENDLKIGRDQLQTPEPVTDMVCYHMQQCAEKYLKAYLVFHTTPFRRTHDLAELIELCKEIDPEFEQLYHHDVDRLTVYGIEIRYPDDFYIPTRVEADTALGLALTARDFVRKKLKQAGHR